jgi:UDP-N-acetylglucosamine transferase subunit ALG13
LSTFVSVGNAEQPFGRLVDAIVEIKQWLPEPLVFQHGHTPLQASSEYTGVPFMNMDDFSDQLVSSDLLILHAGAGSLIHALQAGKVPVVMPRRAVHGEHIDDHQLELSLALEREQRIILVHEPARLLEGVARAMLVQQKPKVRVKRTLAIVSQVSDLLDSLATSQKP